ncbi:MAG: hypothetical protein U0P81_14880 [Holophagaceae bacterium]
MKEGSLLRVLGPGSGLAVALSPLAGALAREPRPAPALAAGLLLAWPLYRVTGPARS